MVYKASDFKRYKMREDKQNVKYWFERKKGFGLVSLIRNPYELRISTGKEAFTVKPAFGGWDTISDKEALRIAVMHMNRRKKLKEVI
jgi:hypothetical protein